MANSLQKFIYLHAFSQHKFVTSLGPILIPERLRWSRDSVLAFAGSNPAEVVFFGAN